jgi:hypothetical protein
MLSIEDYFKVETGTVYILGNGPSLNTYDMSKLNPDICMTMNRSWDKVPGARYHINCGDITSVRIFPQNILFVAGDESAVGDAVLRKIRCPVILIQNHNAGPKQLRPKKLKLNIPAGLDLRNGLDKGHAGLAALHAAWWLGYDTAVLLGYDGEGLHYRNTEREKNKIALANSTWSKQGVAKLRKQEVQQYKKFAKKLVGRMRVYNCLKDNAYEVHPFIPFDEAIVLANRT